MTQAIFFPALVMVLLTAVMTFRMFFERVRQMRDGTVSMRDIPSSSQMFARFADTRCADNYRNLFEGPVLFYLALVVAFVIGHVTTTVLVLAWAYVALRVVHSFIHCSYNRIKHRFYAFLASSVVLWALWIVLAIALLT